MLAHDRPLVHGRGALGSPHGHTPSFAANTGPREVTSSAAPREHAPAGGREGEVYRPSYAARALVWVRWTRGAPWFGCCSRGAAQLEARRGEHLHYAQPRVTACSLSAFFILHRHPRRGFQPRVWVCALERDIVAVPRLWHSWPLSAGSWALGRSRTSMDELLSSAGAT